MQALNERLNTNYIPTAEESRMLEEELNASAQKIARIQIKVNDLDNRLDDLTRQKDALEAKTAAYRGMFSPARRLVPDILQEIFIHCLPTTTNPVMSTLEPPLVLGRVCSQWRCIAYGTPALWSAIHVVVSSDSPFSRSNAARALAIMEWLSRAGTIPLSISLWAPHDNSWSLENKARDSTVEHLLDTIGPFLVQCKSIHISVFNAMWNSFLQKYFKGDFPFLYRLSFISGLRHWADEIVYTSLSQISVDNVPKLRMVSLKSCGSKASSTRRGALECFSLPFPWQHLTSLKLYCARWGLNPSRAFRTPDALLLLSWCPSLVFCGISISRMGRPYLSDPTNSTMVTLPCLISLNVGCDIDPKLFFACLNTPSLRYLQYKQVIPRSRQGMDWEDGALHVSLRPFIRKIIHPIEELEIATTYLTQTDIIRCLELFPELKRLSITSLGREYDTPSWDSGIIETSFSGTILDRFMRRLDFSDKVTSEHLDEERFDDLEDFGLSTDNAPCLCPRLERLRIDGASFPDSMVLDFIRFRVLSYAIYGVSRIHWLEIKFPFGRDGDSIVLEEVQDMENQSGTFINVRYGGSYFSGHKRSSPYNGLGSVNSDGVSTYAYNPLFGSAPSVD